ncbi:PTS sugar transporter subunit IIA [Corynebacterium ammoniagenes]|uniref:Ascorbate-specific PTS system EIIA component n=1 Tax=Corynebacterium ammoniagenes TaxID=1697 RepID=A0AAV5G1N8_CORAM|nr:PTS sugar transporter subunit IIA [Corynebacterium ammoniagenes]GJN42059.1 PTS sugar transporter [Corynebacterium ammoniagenes]
MSQLNALLATESIDLHAHAANWRDAISTAGQLLEDSGAITADYTNAMIKSVEDNGPYIVVAPGFAFAHARPSEAVKRTAISWVRLEKPVEFGHDSNDPVNLVVALAAEDDKAHTQSMKDLAKLLGNKKARAQLDSVTTAEELREVLESAGKKTSTSEASTSTAAASSAGATAKSADAVESKGKVLTVCGNGLGTSLFLKNSLDEVLSDWGWAKLINVEATDTISAKGRAKEADFILTSGEIAATLGDVGVPVWVIKDFTSLSEIDAALRELYAL